MDSITKRWLKGGLALTVFVLIFAEALFILTQHSSFYTGVEQALVSRFSSISGQLKMYSGQNTQSPAKSRSLALHRMVEQFDAKDKIEFMLLDAEGNILSTSSGSLKALGDEREDFFLAMDSSEGRGRSVFTTAEDEKVMAVTMVSPYAAGDVVAMRMVTSLALVDQQLARRALISLGVVFVVLAFSIYSGMYFIRSIVVPLQDVEAATASIAQGKLDVRLPVKGSNDEVDRLRLSINRMAEDLAQTEKMKNDFISSVSHELRTPLTSIRGWVETIAAIRDPEDENYRKGLVIIGEETERLYGMVEELLDFSRMQNGIKMECEPLDLVAELTDAALFMEPRMTGEGITLEYNEPEAYLPIYADPRRLRQVFVNVMDNAVKYSVSGGTITLELLQDGQFAYVLVRDQGRGIAEEDLENVKKKFFKGKNAVRGSGIGLAVVDEIMTALDGSVDIDSKLGQGTTVKLMLPIYRPHKAGESPAAEDA